MAESFHSDFLMFSRGPSRTKQCSMAPPYHSQQGELSSVDTDDEGSRSRAKSQSTEKITRNNGSSPSLRSLVEQDSRTLHLRDVWQHASKTRLPTPESQHDRVFDSFLGSNAPDHERFGQNYRGPIGNDGGDDPAFPGKRSCTSAWSTGDSEEANADPRAPQRARRDVVRVRTSSSRGEVGPSSRSSCSPSTPPYGAPSGSAWLSTSRGGTFPPSPGPE